MRRSRLASGSLFLLLSILFVVKEASAFRHVLGFYLHFTNSKAVMGSVLEGGVDPAPFGQGAVFDYPITQMPGLSTTLLGYARGFYVDSSSNAADDSFQEVFTVTFTKYSQYSDSSLSIAGIWYSQVSNGIRELPVVGGTGFFRFATGYAVLEPVYDTETENYFVRIELMIPDL